MPDKDAPCNFINDEDDDLSPAEFELLQEGYREAILISQGKIRF